MSNSIEDIRKSAMIKYNLSVALADAIHSLLYDFEGESRIIGKGLKQVYKQKFNALTPAVKALRLRLKDIASDGYVISEADSFCEDSDYLKKVNMLIAIKTEGDEEKMDKIIKFIEEL